MASKETSIKNVLFDMDTPDFGRSDNVLIASEKKDY